MGALGAKPQFNLSVPRPSEKSPTPSSTYSPAPCRTTVGDVIIGIAWPAAFVLITLIIASFVVLNRSLLRRASRTVQGRDQNSGS